MQKWSLEEFTDERPTLPDPGEGWDQESLVKRTSGVLNPGDLKFQREAGFSDPRSLLSNLTQTERSTLFELVQQDLSRDYLEREGILKAEFEKNLAEAKDDYEQRLETWSRGFGDKMTERVDEDLKEIGKASALLAIQLAGKITRTMVSLDPEILVGVMETTLIKISGSQPIRIVVHPEDELWLKERKELLNTMKISEVSGDRRVERGGCLIQSGGQEWDATLAGQLEAMGEIVQEAIATAGTEDPMLKPEDENDAGLE